MRYYVDYSSVFGTRVRYRIIQIATAVRRAGGKNVRSSYLHGWSNQPKVVTFDAAPSQVTSIGKAVGQAVGTPWIIIHEKDW